MLHLTACTMSFKSSIAQDAKGALATYKGYKHNSAEYQLLALSRKDTTITLQRMLGVSEQAACEAQPSLAGA